MTELLYFGILIYLFAFTADFIALSESFNLVQHVKGPTHNKGHTVDLVLSYGVSLNNFELLDIDISDHKAVIFQTLLPLPVRRPSTFICSWSFNSKSASRFC